MLKYTIEAQQHYEALRNNKYLVAQFKAVTKALPFLQEDPLHPSLHTHKYSSLEGPEESEVFEAYAQNRTPAAYRIFWCYYPPHRDDASETRKIPRSKMSAKHGPEKIDKSPPTITVIAITRTPNRNTSH